MTNRTMLWLGWSLLLIGVSVAIVSLASSGQVSPGQSSAGSTSDIGYGMSVGIGWVITLAGGVLLLITQLRPDRPASDDLEAPGDDPS